MKTSDAIQHFGSSAALARALGINRSAVHQWGDKPPVPRQYQIQVVTDGKLVAERPANTSAA